MVKRMAHALLAGLFFGYLIAMSGCSQLGQNTRNPQQPEYMTEAPLPVLGLPLGSLGRHVAERQRLTVTSPSGDTKVLDALLEIDETSLRMALLQIGHVIARLEWDGETTTATLAPGWPKVVPAERILSEVQMALWPPETVQAHLPAPWQLDYHVSMRQLRHGDHVRLRFEFSDDGRHIAIAYADTGWQLSIDSVDAEPGTRSKGQGQ